MSRLESLSARNVLWAGVAFLVAATAIYASHPVHAQTAGLAELMDGPIPILHSRVLS